MAAADTAKLVASLTLDAKGFQSGVKSAQKSLGGLEGTVGNIGRKAGEGVKAFSRNIALIGVAAAGVIAVGVKSGLDNLAKLETAITSVDGAIEQMGLTGQVTGKQVAEWANQIESDIGAAFDDKDITAGAATLLRYGKVAPKNLKPALVVMTDLAAKTGDVDSAASLLAKSLADPAKAAGKLAKQGIILTKAQQDTIKEMVKQNDIAGAQQIILDELSKTTGGAAAASQGKYARAISVLNDVLEDAQKALATGFLPLIEKVATKLSTAMSNPAFIKGLEDFGTTLAGGLDDLISVAEKLPWSTIGTSLQIAGAGAKTLLDAFVSLPPWVQTAVITGWGLNKLTGGALGGIVSELGKGLIKGVLGINAGHVTVNAATVSGAGTGGNAPTAALGGIGLAAGAAATVGVVIVGIQQAVQASLAGSIVTAITGSEAGGKLAEDVQGGTGGGPLPIFSVFERLTRALSGDFRSELEIQQDLERQQIAETQALSGNVVSALGTNKAQNQRDAFAIRDATSQGAEKNRQAAAAVRDAVNTKVGLLGTITNGVKSAVDATTSASREAGRTAAAAIRDKDLSVSVSTTNVINNTVSVRETIKTQTTYKQQQRFIS